jgi:hypothetical protein
MTRAPPGGSCGANFEGFVMFKTFSCLLAAALLAGWASAAAARPIAFNFTARGSGSTDIGGTFGDVLFRIKATGDTSTFFDDAGVARGVLVDTATLYALGNSSVLHVDPGTAFLVGEGADAGDGFFGALIGGSILSNHELAAPQFVGWDEASKLGPVPVSILQFGPVVLNNGAGPVVFFNRLVNPAFSASVPEPGGWAMMLIGLGALGGALRARRRMQIA